MFHSYVSLPEGKSIEIPRIFLEIHIQLQQLNPPLPSVRAARSQGLAQSACCGWLVSTGAVTWRSLRVATPWGYS